MKREIEFDPHLPLQVVELDDGKEAYIIDRAQYEPSTTNGTVILRKRNTL